MQLQSRTSKAQGYIQLSRSIACQQQIPFALQHSLSFIYSSPFENHLASLASEAIGLNLTVIVHHTPVIINPTKLKAQAQV
jgi:hypothetical protein